MSIRLLVWGGLCAASCLLGACVSKVSAQEAPMGQAPPEEKPGAFCGGIAGLPCPEGYSCVDDPTDSCDPAANGADCGGVCRKEPPARCTADDPTRRYVSRDPEQCAAIRFFCDPGYQPFFNDCGCGCEPAP